MTFHHPQSVEWEERSLWLVGKAVRGARALGEAKKTEDKNVI
jgi:hypothetical protein